MKENGISNRQYSLNQLTTADFHESMNVPLLVLDHLTGIRCQFMYVASQCVINNVCHNPKERKTEHRVGVML